MIKKTIAFPKMSKLLTSFLLFIFIGGVFLTSNLFMNAEIYIKNYFILSLSLVVLFICSVRKNGMQELFNSARSNFFQMGMLAIGIALSIHGLLQYFTVIPTRNLYFSITGSFDNPAGFVAVQSMIFPIGLTMWLRKDRSKATRIMASLTTILIAFTVVLSGSRAGILAVFIASVIILLLETKIIALLRRYKWLLAILLISLPCTIFLLYQLKTDSADGRMYIWRICLDMILDRPVFGFGFHGFNAHYMDYQAAFLTTHPNSAYAMLADNITCPFNEFIEWTVNYGLLGLSIVFFLLVLIIRATLRSERYIRCIGLSTISAILVLSSLSYPFYYTAVWFLTGILLITILPLPSFIPGRIVKMVRFSVAALLICSFLLVCRMAYLDIKWNEMANISMKGYSMQMLPYFEKMKPKKQYDPLFLYNYSAELSISGMYGKSQRIVDEYIEKYNDYDVQLLIAENYTNMGQTEKAIQAYRHASHMIPCRFVPYSKIMDLYIKQTDLVNAKLIAKEILQKPIKVQSNTVSSAINSARQLLQICGEQ